MLLLLTMVVLLVLSSLAGASLINSLLERSQVSSQANAAIALNAGEGGIAAGMAWLSDPANSDNYPSTTTDVPDPSTIANAYTTNTGWQTWSNTLTRNFPKRDLSGDGDTDDPYEMGGSYTVNLRFKRERRDRNGDGDCCDKYPEVAVDESSEFKDGDTNACTDCPGELVLYNEGTGDGHFGFSDSYYSGNHGDEGFPLMEIDTVGTYGASSVREIALFVVRNHKAQVEGAFTTRTPVNATTLNKVIDGTNPPCAPLPGIIFDVGMSLPCDVNSDGVCDTSECSSEIPKVVGCAETFDPTQPGKRPLAKTPWDALGITEVDFESLFTRYDSSTLSAATCNTGEPVNLWFTQDLTNAPNKTCKGIIVVHNPKFDPDKWDPASSGYDATYASDNANAPASFATTGAGSFTWDGIVIADQVGKVNSNITVNGGVISLASGGAGVVTDLQGSFSIKYNCDNVAAVTKRIGYKKKIGWQRLR